MAHITGITGGIGAGKSMVSRILRCMGFEVYDCDSEARRIMESSDTLKREIADCLGAECLSKEGALCRPAIARIIFADDSRRTWLNSRVHNLVREDIVRRSEACGEIPFFVESAIMRTSRLDVICDTLWIVNAPMHIRLGRACRRDGCAQQEIYARMESQASEYENLACPRIEVIVNDDDVPVLPQISRLLADL